MEVPEANAGGNLFPTFLKRGPLPKAAAAAGAGLPGQRRLAPEDCFAPGDLRVGTTVAILGRTFLIYGCDEATRAWCQVGACSVAGQGALHGCGCGEASGHRALYCKTGGCAAACTPRPLPPPRRRSAWATPPPSWRPSTFRSRRAPRLSPRCRRTAPARSQASGRPRTACRTACAWCPSRPRRTSTAGSSWCVLRGGSWQAGGALCHCCASALRPAQHLQALPLPGRVWACTCAAAT